MHSECTVFCLFIFISSDFIRSSVETIQRPKQCNRSECNYLWTKSPNNSNLSAKQYKRRNHFISIFYARIEWKMIEKKFNEISANRRRKDRTITRSTQTRQWRFLHKKWILFKQTDRWQSFELWNCQFILCKQKILVCSEIMNETHKSMGERAKNVTRKVHFRIVHSEFNSFWWRVSEAFFVANFIFGQIVRCTQQNCISRGWHWCRLSELWESEFSDDSDIDLHQPNENGKKASAADARTFHAQDCVQVNCKWRRNTCQSSIGFSTALHCSDAIVLHSTN